MKLNTIYGAVFALMAAFTLNGCGDDSNNNNTIDIELDSDGKTLIFYSSSTNDHLAYNVDEAKVENLNSSEYPEFNMDTDDNGKFFIWIDNKGDDNVSNDEEKVIMFKESYSYAEDGNATWEDFYYLGHYHAEEEDGDTHYHLAAHTSDEFNVTEGAKYLAMQRLNAYIASEAIIESNLTTALSTTSLCGFKTVTNDNGTLHYAMGTNGTLYIYDASFSIVDTVAISDSCQENKMGISAVTHHDENGVVVFEANSQKLYVVDSHDDGVFHPHYTYDISEVIGSGKSVEMMVSLIPVGYEADEEHDH